MATTRLARPLAAAAAVLAGALVMAGCQSSPTDPGGSASSGSSVQSTDDGTKITMWTRSSTAPFTEALVKAYNASHKNQVTLTVIPFDAYQQKVAAAAGSKQLPDIISSDVVYTPNYVSKGILRDLTPQVEALPFAKNLAPGHIESSSKDGKIYAVPHDIDLSAVFYNKVLFKRAGLDPEAPPTTLTGWMDAARKINSLGSGVNGFYFGGNCGGCMLFTTWPSVWADGGTVMNDEGTAAQLDAPEAKNVYALYRKAWEEKLTPRAAETETGATFGAAFGTGKIGIQILGATAYGSYKQDDSLQIGVAPVPGVNGGESSFIGGDVLGIPTSSANANAAWNFLEWSLSEEAQINVIAKGGNLPARTDLADNEYSAKDPNIATLGGLVAKGKTPVSANFGSVFNDAQGPWGTYYREAIFGDPSKLDAANAEITSALESGS
jgi:multiple sugar transport system substrate-binding protein